MSDQKRPTSKQANQEDQLNNFIPDLCQANSVLFLLLLTQIFAFFVSIIASSSSLIEWEVLGLLSIYCHAVTFSCAAITCRLKTQYSGYSIRKITVFFISLNTLVTLAYSYFFLQFVPVYAGIEDNLFLLKSGLICAVISGLLLRYFYLQHQWRLQKQAELQARLQALQSRIRPHFLFNSMNSIAGLISINPAEAEDAILDLSELFRATLANESLMTPMSQELALCKRYLNIESLRLGDRLKTKWEISPELENMPIPALSLQPLFENAVYHGIQPRVDGGTISFKAHREKSYVYLLVSNPLPVDSKNETHHGNQLALSNIKSRFQAIYGERAVVKTSLSEGQFNVTMRLPWERDNA